MSSPIFLEEEAGIPNDTRITILNSLFEAARAGEKGEPLAELAAELSIQGKETHKP